MLLKGVVLLFFTALFPEAKDIMCLLDIPL